MLLALRAHSGGKIFWNFVTPSEGLLPVRLAVVTRFFSGQIFGMTWWCNIYFSGCSLMLRIRIYLSSIISDQQSAIWTISFTPLCGNLPRISANKEDYSTNPDIKPKQGHFALHLGQ
jgi:hypothetical protein